MKIVEASIEEMDEVGKLFREYQNWLGIDLCFQGFEQELANLPGDYAPPSGVIYLAKYENDYVGCVAVRSRTEREAELKRLYVQSAYQGKGVGTKLFTLAMSKTKDLGYTSIVLDTLSSMQAARSLYLSYGFKKIPAYYNNPELGVEFYKYRFTL